MNCTEFDSRLRRLIEDRVSLDAADALREHASACASCRKQWQRFVVLTSAVDAWKAAVPKTDLAEAIIVRAQPASRGEQETGEARSPDFRHRGQASAAASLSRHSGPDSAGTTSRSRLAVLAATAAAVLLVALQLRHPPVDGELADRDSKETANETVAAGDGGTPRDDAPRLSGLLADARVAYLGLARNAAEAVQGGAILIPEVQQVQGGDTDEEQTETSPSEWLNSWGPQVDAALEYLEQAVPGEAPTT